MLENPEEIQAWTQVVEEWGGALVTYGYPQLLVANGKGKVFTIDMPEEVPAEDDKAKV